MDLSDVLAARRTVRRFTDEEVPDDVLRRVLAAGLAMPHGGNTYDWRAIVLRRARTAHPRWEQIFDAVWRQEYLAEAPVLVVWAVQPRWWLDHYPGNLATLVERGLVQPARAGTLLDRVSVRQEEDAVLPLLVGEAMLAVAGVLLAAIAEGLGTALSGCNPAALGAALGVPADARIAPAGVLALGHAGDDDAGGRRAPKPAPADVCFDAAWGHRLA